MKDDGSRILFGKVGVGREWFWTMNGVLRDIDIWYFWVIRLNTDLELPTYNVL